MCRIFVNPMNKIFNKEELRKSYEWNNDGTGLFYWNKNTKKYTVKKWEKGTDFEVIWKVVSHLHQHKNVCNVNLHFRFGTSGGIGYDQTHPIFVNNGTFLMHNGVCQDFEWNKNLWSDTQCMAFWLRGLMRKNKMPSVEKLDKIFAGNKLVLMQRDKYTIINEQLGQWGDDGIWRSFKF